MISRIRAAVIALLVTLILGFAVRGASAAERDHQLPWCEAHFGIAEYRIPGGRVDCLTETHAWEFDWGAKADECLGQALRYAVHTGHRAGCVLIIRDTKDCTRAAELRRTIHHHALPVDLEMVGGDQR